jgi:emp24/gp25L/p24 family/GOLD
MSRQASDLIELTQSHWLSFNVHGVIYVGEDDVVAPIEREIRALANSLTSVKDEQEYIVVRERVHRNTAESTNARVKWWSVLQAVVLFAVVAWQVYYLKVRLTFKLRSILWLTWHLAHSRSLK